MPRNTTNKSMRLAQPIKALRRESVVDAEADEDRSVPGATSTPTHSRRRPGRAAALKRNAASNRSQRWRSTEKSPTNKRRGVLAKQTRTSGRKS